MKIYLAARYGRRMEICGYRDELIEAKHEVTSNWLDGPRQVLLDGSVLGWIREESIENGTADPRTMADMFHQIAEQNFRDIESSDALISFTEPADSKFARGGRHVEMGLAMGRIPIFVVGYRENVFCWNEGSVQFFRTWGECLEKINR